jgi:hypothetical protein
MPQSARHDFFCAGFTSDDTGLRASAAAPAPVRDEGRASSRKSEV